MWFNPSLIYGVIGPILPKTLLFQLESYQIQHIRYKAPCRVPGQLRALQVVKVN